MEHGTEKLIDKLLGQCEAYTGISRVYEESGDCSVPWEIKGSAAKSLLKLLATEL